ncbi:deoxyribodipyrimidine photo-lyase/cryptochrome family protein [Dinoroseobacter sp. S375]|uniref:cryptochrome/deoxyribodipyrimidine photo-lyase family protein n=1 Tax=Dinoroseobacter sp. S375 TaxID=3415136 RepID=UPI003C7D44BC
MTALSPVLVWFKRDLRVEDHPALCAAAALGPVLPVYVVEPEYWAEPDTSARQWAFTRESVASLAAALARLGAPLRIETGQAVAVFEALRVTHGITRMISHEETGNSWTFARDRAVAAWARAQGVRWDELPQSGVVRRLAGRDGWARQRDQRMATPQQPVPALRGVAGAGAMGGALPDAADLGLAADPCPGRQPGGRDAALSLLGGFLTERGQTYRAAMANPLDGAAACSRLSPHLALGNLSGREATQAAKARKVEAKGTRDGWIGAMKSFEARLAWRDHFMQKLEDQPSLEHRCLHSAYEGLRPAQPDATRLEAWARGETGLPFVDACMRSLIATGWLNFRARAMLVAVASYHLWLDWRASGVILGRYFTDFEPGIHWPQVQMQSGTTGMNTVRIYNPVKQGHDNDPAGVFTRRWLPELARVPDRYLQEPWRWDGAGQILDRHYPAPIVDPKAAAAEARQKVWAIRTGAEFRAEAAHVVEKHASRKDPQGRFVDDRAPRKARRATATRTRGAKPAPDQLSFDL